MVKNAYIIPGLPSNDLDLLVKASDLKDINEVLDRVCEVFKMNLEDILGYNRKGDIPLARHLAVFLIKKKFKITATSVGSIFSGKHYSSVLHSIKTVYNVWDTDKEFRHLVIRVLTS